jgi:hypothetical protein
MMGRVQPTGIAVDKMGNTIVAGNYSGTIGFAPGAKGTFTSDPTACAQGSYFIASFNAAGVYKWGFSFDAIGNNATGNVSVAVDATGEVFLVAPQYQTFTLNQMMYQNTGLFVAEFSSAGMVDAAQTYPGSASATVAASPSGWVLAGSFYGSLTLGATTLTTTAGGIRPNVFVALFFNVSSPAGGAVYGYGDAPGYPPGSQGAAAVAVNQGGQVVVAGGFQSSIKLGTMPLVANGSLDVFLAKFPQPLGTATWSNHYGGQGYPGISAVTFDAIGSILVAGTLTAPIDLGNGQPATVTAQTGYGDGFIAKYDPAGSYKWSKTFGGAMERIGPQSILSDPNDAVFVAGDATTPIDFGGGALMPAGMTTPSGIVPNVYLVKLDPNGNQLWAKLYGDANGQQNAVAATDPTTGEILLAFANNGTVSFSNGPVATQGLVVARLHP